MIGHEEIGREEAGFMRTALHAGSGVIVWAAHFTIVYAFTALACARGFDTLRFAGIGVVGWVVGTASVVATVLLLAWILPAVNGRGEGDDFVGWLRATLAALALVAVAFEAVAVPMVPTCG